MNDNIIVMVYVEGIINYIMKVLLWIVLQLLFVPYEKLVPWGFYWLLNFLLLIHFIFIRYIYQVLWYGCRQYFYFIHILWNNLLRIYCTYRVSGIDQILVVYLYDCFKSCKGRSFLFLACHIGLLNFLSVEAVFLIVACHWNFESGLGLCIIL